MFRVSFEFANQSECTIELLVFSQVLRGRQSLSAYIKSLKSLHLMTIGGTTLYNKQLECSHLFNRTYSIKPSGEFSRDADHQPFRHSLARSHHTQE
jgi:hypothetical protein